MNFERAFFCFLLLFLLRDRSCYVANPFRRQSISSPFASLYFSALIYPSIASSIHLTLHVDPSSASHRSFLRFKSILPSLHVLHVASRQTLFPRFRLPSLSTYLPLLLLFYPFLPLFFPFPLFPLFPLSLSLVPILSSFPIPYSDSFFFPYPLTLLPLFFPYPFLAAGPSFHHFHLSAAVASLPWLMSPFFCRSRLFASAAYVAFLCITSFNSVAAILPLTSTIQQVIA